MEQLNFSQSLDLIPTYLHHLKLAFQRLDSLLSNALIAAKNLHQGNLVNNSYGGYHLSLESVESLFERKPGEPLLWTYSQNDEFIPLQALGDLFCLSPFDLDVILIALAPEFDLRYEKIYSYLQDDLHKVHPTVNLVLNLLCQDASEKLTRRNHFNSDSPLIRHQLVTLIPSPNHLNSSFLSYSLKLDKQVIAWLLADCCLDERINSVATLSQPAVTFTEVAISQTDKQKLQQCGKKISFPGSESREFNNHKNQGIRLYFHGVSDLCKIVGEALAKEIGKSLLILNIAHVVEQKLDFRQILTLASRESLLHNSLLYLEAIDSLGDQNSFLFQQLCSILSSCLAKKITIIFASKSLIQPAVMGELNGIVFHFPIPDYQERKNYWEWSLNNAHIELNIVEVEALADRFRLTPQQIRNSIKSTCHERDYFNLNQEEILHSIFASVRSQSGYDLKNLARKIAPKYHWRDLILHPNKITVLKELSEQGKYGHIVYENWGFGAKLSLGKGLSALFAGTPGTGKTMAAEVIANDLQLDLYKIDLSQVVSKYIGETEKNLDRIFTAAENANGILLFDEADALFGKRSDVKDARDRYANIEIGYLLQKIEEYAGIAILTTNFRSNLDDAFVRRLRFIVEFPFPDEVSRLQIWQHIFPKELPKDKEIDWNYLATRFELSGGNIRNVAIAASFLAASSGEVLTMNHLIHGIKREYQKMGKVLIDK